MVFSITRSIAHRGVLRMQDENYAWIVVGSTLLTHCKTEYLRELLLPFPDCRKHAQRTIMYFRKILGTRTRFVNQTMGEETRGIIRDFVNYLVDKQRYRDALEAFKGIFESSTHYLRRDPQLQAHAAIIRLGVSLLESAYATKGLDQEVRKQAEERSEDEDEQDERGKETTEIELVRIPDLHRPLPLVEPLQECLKGGPGGHERARLHAIEAQKLLSMAASANPGDTSVAVYKAILAAASGNVETGVSDLENFVVRNPGPSNIKARATLVGLLELEREGKIGRSHKCDVGGGKSDQNQHQEFTSARLVCALKDWLVADPLEAQAALGLEELFWSSGSNDVIDEEWLIKALVSQIEVHCTSQNTAALALKLWEALARVLGPLRVQDSPTPLAAVPRPARCKEESAEGGDVPGEGLSACSGAKMVLLDRLPLAGTVHAALYGNDRPWGDTDLDAAAAAAAPIKVTSGLPSVPVTHPWLEGLDLGWWSDVFFGAEEVLSRASRNRIIDGRDKGKGRGSECISQDGFDDEPWCSEDEDCVVGDVAEAIGHRTCLAEGGDGGLLYYFPPEDGGAGPDLRRGQDGERGGEGRARAQKRRREESSNGDGGKGEEGRGGLSPGGRGRGGNSGLSLERKKRKREKKEEKKGRRKKGSAVWRGKSCQEQTKNRQR
ncbi:unnamed protein product [Choristocarpus tenellus]